MIRIIAPGNDQGLIDVSVCIANYNGIGLIDECVGSVRAQDVDLAVEIIVHDDASTDGSAAHILARHPEVRLIESCENVGFCAANNRMAAQARGAYLLLLNNDAALMPDALAVLHGEAVGLGYPAVLSLPQYDAETGECLDMGGLLDPFFNTAPNHDPRRAEVAMAAGSCLWLPHALWRETGGFPEWFGSLAEDLYLCCRLRLAGYAVRVPARSGYRHHVGHSLGGGKVQAGRLESTYRRRALSERNRACVIAMACPAPLVYALLPLHGLLLLAEGLLLSMLRWSRRPMAEIYLPSLAALLARRRQILALRRDIMAARRIGTGRFLSVFTPVPHKLRMLLKHGLPWLG